MDPELLLAAQDATASPPQGGQGGSIDISLRDLFKNVIKGVDPTLGVATHGIQPGVDLPIVQMLAGLMAPGPSGGDARMLGAMGRRLPDVFGTAADVPVDAMMRSIKRVDANINKPMHLRDDLPEFVLNANQEAQRERSIAQGVKMANFLAREAVGVGALATDPEMDVETGLIAQLLDAITR